MTARHLWYVDTREDMMIVLAETRDEALDLAMEFCGDNGDNDSRDQYIATLGGVSNMRWVGFESAEDAADQVRDLDARGVTVDRLLTRTTSQPGIDEIHWEVGARDADWCLLPSGVLCGGAD